MPSLRSRPGINRVSHGTRTFAIGNDPLMNDRKTVKEVRIPPERCVYYWLGCPYKRRRRNYCHRHYIEALALGDLAPYEVPPQPLCVKCGKLRSSRSHDWCRKCLGLKHDKTYREKNREKIKARRAKERAANRELIREQDREYRRKNQDRIKAQRAERRRRTNAGTQERGSEVNYQATV